MNYTFDKLLSLKDQSRARVMKARDTVSAQVKGTLPLHAQLATWKLVKQNPVTQARIQKERGIQGWQEYARTMTALEQKED